MFFVFDFNINNRMCVIRTFESNDDEDNDKDWQYRWYRYIDIDMIVRIHLSDNNKKGNCFFDFSFQNQMFIIINIINIEWKKNRS